MSTAATETRKNQLALAKKKFDTLRGLLASDTMKQRMMATLPKHLTPERMTQVAMVATMQTPLLLDCTQESVINCVLKCSQLGLIPDPFLGEAYLIPFRNNKKNVYECTLIPGYRGLVKLARQSGEISTIYAQVVHKKDEFDFHFGDNPEIKHHPYVGPDGPGEFVAAYAIAKFKDGQIQREVMLKREIDLIRGRSKSSNNGPWVTDYEEMAKKTVIRRLFKLLPTSTEMQMVMTHNPNRFADAIDTTMSADELDIDEAMLIGGEDSEAAGSAPKSLEDVSRKVEERNSKETPAAKEESPGELIDLNLKTLIESLMDECGVTKAEEAEILKSYGVSKLLDLSQQNAKELRANLEMRQAKGNS